MRSNDSEALQFRMTSLNDNVTTGPHSRDANSYEAIDPARKKAAAMPRLW